jgi:hypothetical protein
LVDSDARAVLDCLSREQIRDVIDLSVRGIDRVDRSMILAAYHPLAREEHSHFDGTVEDFAEFVCGPRSERFVGTTHLLGYSRVELDGEIARSMTSCLAHRLVASRDGSGSVDFVSGVRFLDELERREGSWAITHRRCVGDWSCTVSVEPGLLPHDESVLNGRRDGSDFSRSWWTAATAGTEKHD